MDGRTVEPVDSDLIGIVERRRAEGLSVAAACREAGISTSTYYRKRRAGTALTELVADGVGLMPPPETVGLMVKGESRSWPFTARAPFYWDQVFADELSDSFVRREFGRGAGLAPARGALTALAGAAPGLAPSDPMDQILQRARRLLRDSRLQNASAPVVAALFFVVVAAASVWMVSVAADPAAWIDPGQSRIAESTVGAADVR